MPRNYLISLQVPCHPRDCVQRSNAENGKHALPIGRAAWYNERRYHTLFGKPIMRRILPAFCLLLAIALPCHAQGDKAKPNTLTPKEIADGWILLFDGETTFGWTGRASVTKPTLPNRFGLRLTVVGQDNKFGFIGCNTAFQEFELNLTYSTPHVGAATIYLVPADTKEHNAKMDRFALPGSARATEASFRVTAQSFSGKTSTKTDGEVEFPETKRTTPNQPINLVFESGSVNLHRVMLRPLNTKSIFNGKDLTGWKEFPGRKSKFAVADGAITVTNGPGDLQTVGKYQDFVLQLEAISNGKHLNSGIFFRCKDNEYQNGYEAQILNKFTAEATQDYTIEEYDPQTNKLLAKNKIKATAVDFGTGAIYRRVPARKEMSKDGEWFGMTIVAHGNHLATWVNGVQVTDWYDNRPKSDNPRTGYRAEAGHISIQGHDPTTNLSFKNFRIAELK